MVSLTKTYISYYYSLSIELKSLKKFNFDWLRIHVYLIIYRIFFLEKMYSSLFLSNLLIVFWINSNAFICIIIWIIFLFSRLNAAHDNYHTRRADAFSVLLQTKVSVSFFNKFFQSRRSHVDDHIWPGNWNEMCRSKIDNLLRIAIGVSGVTTSEFRVDLPTIYLMIYSARSTTHFPPRSQTNAWWNGNNFSLFERKRFSMSFSRLFSAPILSNTNV